MCLEDNIRPSLNLLIDSSPSYYYYCNNVDHNLSSLKTLFAACYDFLYNCFSKPFEYIYHILIRESDEAAVMAYEFYRYNAEASAGLLAAGFFGLILLVAGYRVWRTGVWWLGVSVGAIGLDVVGLITRSVSILQPQNLGAYMISVVFLTTAPSIQAASVYMLAGRVISRLTPPERQNISTLWLNPRYLSAIFISQTVLSVSMQLVGIGYIIGAIAGTSNSKPSDPEPDMHAAMYMLVIGFSVQIFTVLWFLVVVARFQVGFEGWRRGGRGRFEVEEKVVKTIFYVLYFSAALLLIRSVYRLNHFLAETSPLESFLVTEEWPFWVCEIFVVSLMYTCYLIPQYPGRWFEKGGALEDVGNSNHNSNNNDDFDVEASASTRVPQKQDKEMDRSRESTSARRLAFAGFEFGLT
ncbi:hypothetical protein TWF730_005013 [Orbilia blumenaviensis]|uniref:Uncharacterized protein n=1 Tax=Orbilia blumenaviensis TaxID=1796055 RepID=A0AAV9VGZ7_9PEZI